MATTKKCGEQAERKHRQRRKHVTEGQDKRGRKRQKNKNRERNETDGK